MNLNNTIRQPSEAEKQAALKDFFTRQSQVQTRHLDAAALARPALARLVECCRHKTGQGYKIRALLFSLWNGQPADLSEVLSLDYNLREDLCAVILAFGFESRDPAVKPFFYDAMTAAFKAGGIFDWFSEAYNGENKA